MLLIIFSLLITTSKFFHVGAKVYGSFVLPHGGVALNPSGFHTTDMRAKQKAWKINQASVDVGRYIRRLEPDLIVLSTPHGVADAKNFAFYMAPNANGSAETDNCDCPPCCYSASVPIDAFFTQEVLNNLTAKRLNVTGISFFGNETAIIKCVKSFQSALLIAVWSLLYRWGEVVPLLFIGNIGRSKVVIFSHPSKKLYEILEETSLKVVVVISSDLAHTHDASSPYGFSTSAAPFDRACGHWASTLRPTYLLKVAANHAEKV
uniref:Extradiol ring-cleavage dioxygenase class III enzyme subunit B domain-containing protein n=1 Tax=Romanomermis culicivorax TaxID=13658 RepID=A0A915HQK6_ROMCU